jgi:hypothetical protein
MPRTEVDNATCNAEFKKKLSLVMIPAVDANNKRSLRIHHTLNQSFLFYLLRSIEKRFPVLFPLQKLSLVHSLSIMVEFLVSILQTEDEKKKKISRNSGFI